MSIVEPEKLIILISDLEDLLSSWNMMALDALSHTEKMRRESIEVYNSAEKDKNRSVETEGTDIQFLKKSKEQSDRLSERSSELKRQTSLLPNHAEIRVQKWKHSYELSIQYVQYVEEWLKTANKEFERAQHELNEAKNNFNDQVDCYNAAVTRLKSTPPIYEVKKTDLEGQEYKELGPNPEYEFARLDVEEQESKLSRRRKTLNDKKRIHELAQEQKEKAEEAYSIVDVMKSKSRYFLEKAFDLKEWAYDAEKSASYAISAAETVLKLNDEAETMCKKQNEIKDEVIRQSETINTYQDKMHNITKKIIDHTNSCGTVITRFVMMLNNKKTLLYRLSEILPDKITPFTPI